MKEGLAAHVPGQKLAYVTLHTQYIVSQVVTVLLTHKHKIPFAISVVTTDGEWVS